MSLSAFSKCVCILLFLQLAVKVDSETCGHSIRKEYPSFIPEDYVKNDLGYWPWLVGIMKQDSNGHYVLSCSGFLVDTRHVISAAHCFRERGDDLYRARIGNTNPDIADEYRITRIVVPSGYKDGLFYDDIAVLTLDRGVNFTNFNPACLPDQEVIKMNLTRRGSTVVGWRRDSFESDMKDELMYLTQLPIISNRRCQKIIRQKIGRSFERQFPRGISKDFICAGYKESNLDVCKLLSGSPQMIRKWDRWYAIGFLLFGKNCGFPGMPEGYIRVSNYVEWIKENTRD